MMDFLKIRLLPNGLIYVLQGTNAGVIWESWLEPELAVKFVRFLVKGRK
jgi:hypothetical protein